jgi:ubiquinone/menaquinone biosynthesis C-methylase UbiE
VQPAATKMVAAMNKYPSSSEPNETGFNLAFNTSRPFYRELQATPERSRRFGAAMRWFTSGGRFAVHHLIKSYDWAAFDHDGGVVVDVGGGHGSISLALARATTHLRFIVQDLPVVAAQGAKSVPTELKDRVSFVAHDFFAPQPVQGAAIYFMRTVLHNWSDAYASRILAALLPALREGSRIVVYEYLPPDVATTAWSEKQP